MQQLAVSTVVTVVIYCGNDARVTVQLIAMTFIDLGCCSCTFKCVLDAECLLVCL